MSYVREKIANNIPRKLRIGEIMRELLNEDMDETIRPTCVEDMFRRHILFKHPDPKKRIIIPTHLKQYTDQLNSVCHLVKDKDSGLVRIAFAAPPQHTKSTTTFAFLALLPWTQWAGLTSYYLTMATAFAETQMQEFMNFCAHVSIPFKKRGLSVTLFPKGCPRTKIVFGSMQVGITGRAVPGICVIDDPISSADATYSSMNEQVYRIWSTDVATRAHGPIIVMATRWSKNDLIGKLLAEPDWGFDYIRIPCEAEENDSLGRKPGDLLWPEKWGWEHLRPIKRNKNTWFALYQGTPPSEISRMISFPVRYDSIPSGPKKVAYGLDGAQGGSKKNDWSCIYRIESDTSVPIHKRIYYVTGGMREQLLGPHGGHTIKGSDGQKRITRVDENKGWGKLFGDFVQNRPGPVRWDYAGQEKGIATSIKKFFPGDFIAQPASKSKHERAQPFIEALNEGRVLFPQSNSKDSTWVNECIDSLVNWSPDSHDGSDDLDALASAFKQLSMGNVFHKINENKQNMSPLQKKIEHSHPGSKGWNPSPRSGGGWGRPRSI